jgi:hypothetical protein
MFPCTGPVSVRSQGPVARNPLSRPQTRAAAAVSEQQPALTAAGRPLHIAQAVRESRAAVAVAEPAAESSQEEDDIGSRTGAGSSALGEAEGGHPTAAVNGSAPVQQNGATSRSEEAESVLWRWRAQRGAELEAQLLKTELQPLCRKYGLPTTGRKEKIVQRLLNYEAVHRTAE